LVCVLQVWEEIAIVTIGLSFALYYERSITKYPLALRIIRLTWFPRREAGKAFQYTTKDAFLVLAINNAAFFSSIYLFVHLVLPGYRMAIEAMCAAKILGHVIVLIDMTCILVLPSMALHCSRSLIQLFLRSDFVRYLHSEQFKGDRSGISKAVADEIETDIFQKKYRSLASRSGISIIGLFFAGLAPNLLGSLLPLLAKLGIFF